MLEIRTSSYSNKAAILHIDRREEFKRKLFEKENPKKRGRKKAYDFEVKF